MSSQRLWMAALLILLSAALPAVGADPPPANPAPPADANRDAEALAATIDRHVAALWRERNVKPAPLADDAEFVRRAYLDIVGRIPSTSEARAFLADKDPYKRPKLVDRLVDSPAYVNNFTNVWRNMLLPEADSNYLVGILASGVEAWLRKGLAENHGYDRMVRELVATPIPRDARRGRGFNFGGNEINPMVFYMAKEAKPENLAAATSQMFLGVKIECAQCHDHPFAKWTRNQFWEFAAFFAGVQRQNNNDNVFDPIREVTDRREILIPGTDSSPKVIQAAFLDGTEPEWKFQKGARETLADWMTSPSNPFFARAAVNRMWAHFFGAGIVDPVDDFRDDNPASHPELLDELARQFAAHKFDPKFMIRAITLSKAYQLTSALTDPSQTEIRLFSRMAVKGLTGDQLFDSLAVATGYRDPVPFQFRQQANAGLMTPRAQVVNKFTTTDKRTEKQTSILHALALMNGKFVADATTVGGSDMLTAIAEAPFMNTASRIETLYLATLSRKPRPDELDAFVKYVESGGPKKDPKVALSDVFWALLNSSEFILNH